MDQLEQFDKQQLRDYAAERGIEVHHSLSRENMIAKIRAEEGTLKAGSTDKDAEERVWIQLHKTDDDTGSDAVPVTVNGYTYLINRGVPVHVPRSVVEVLQNAIRTKYRWVEKEKRMDTKEVLAYPFSFVSGPRG